MISSMTAYARQQEHTDSAIWLWEIRSVNQRYLDLNFRLPEAFRSLEVALRERIQKQLKRGKVDVFLRWDVQAQNKTLNVDEEYLAQLKKALHVVGGDDKNLNPCTAMDLLRWPGVIANEVSDEESLKQTLLTSFDIALEQLCDSRQREGQAMRTLIEDRIAIVLEQVQTVESQQSLVREQLKEKLMKRLNDLQEKVDFQEGRLEQELALQLQKIDVAEEIDRLQTHAQEVLRILKKGGACGRRLDFMMQELNREANTLSSKAATTDFVQVGVELKVLIEQMREQVQNIE